MTSTLAYPSQTTEGAPLLSALRSMGAGAANIVAETLWPTRCAVCDAPGLPLCDQCRRSLPYIDVLLACPLCGAPFGRIQCTECNLLMLGGTGYDHFPLTAMASAVVLGGAPRRIVTTYKDQGEQRLARDIASLMARYVPPLWLETRPTITYVPATVAARRRRGFDHGELLARELSWLLGCEMVPLLSVGRRRDQRALTRADRAANMSAAVELLPGASAPPSLIVTDDVCTTGATLYACAAALARAGARTIFGLTFARA